MKLKRILALGLASAVVASQIPAYALYSEKVTHDTVISGHAGQNTPYKGDGTGNGAIPEAYEFYIDGKSFSLLDTDESGNYFVIANDYYGNYEWAQNAPIEDDVLFEYTDTGTKDESGNEIWTVEIAPNGKFDYTKVVFNPSNENNIAHFLNNKFISEGNGTYALPNDIKNNIVEHSWKIEKTYGYSDNANEADRYYRSSGNICYTDLESKTAVSSFMNATYRDNNPIPKQSFTAKIALPSYEELTVYADKLGVKQTGSNGFLTRNIVPYMTGKHTVNPGKEGWQTVQNESGEKVHMQFYPLCVRNFYDSEAVNIPRRMQSYYQYLANTEQTDAYRIRPCFWLDKDFFKKVALDVTCNESGVINSIGSEVLNAIKQYTVEEVYYIYDEGTLEKLGYTIPEYKPAEIIDPFEGYGNYPNARNIVMKNIADGQYNAENVPTNSITEPRTTDDSFYVKDNAGNERRFILLDRDDDGNYLLMADEDYGKKTFSTCDRDTEINTYNFSQENWRFDPTNEKSVAYWLNNAFLNSGNGGKILPESMVEKMIEKEWVVENNYTLNTVSDSDDLVDGEAGKITQFISTRDGQRSFKAKVSLISYSEYLAYKDKIAAADREDGTGIMTRTSWSTVSAKSDKSASYVNNFWHIKEKYAGGKYVDYTHLHTDGNMKFEYFIRPVFWVSSDFFKKVKISVLDTDGSNRLGKNPAKQIRQYNIADAELLYDTSEIQAIGYSSDLPKITYLSLGSPMENVSVNAAYTFAASASGASENGTEYKWYRASAKDGEFTLIENAVSASYTPTAEDVGKYLKVEVIPKDSLNYIGKRVEAVSTSAVRAYKDGSIEVNLYDQEDNWLGEVSSSDATELKATFTFTDFNKSCDRIIILALYNKQGQMLKMNYEQASVLVTPSQEFSVKLENIVCGEGYYVKALVWDSITGMTPYFIEKL